MDGDLGTSIFRASPFTFEEARHGLRAGARVDPGSLRAEDVAGAEPPRGGVAVPRAVARARGVGRGGILGARARDRSLGVRLRPLRRSRVRRRSRCAARYGMTMPGQPKIAWTSVVAFDLTLSQAAPKSSIDVMPAPYSQPLVMLCVRRVVMPAALMAFTAMLAGSGGALPRLNVHDVIWPPIVLRTATRSAVL